MTEIVSERPFPRGAVLAAGTVLAVTIFAAVFARWTDAGTLHMPEAPAAEAVAISFEDRADGAVVVRTEDGAERAVLAPGTNGFIRGVLRGLARERRMNGKGADTPFHLVLRVDGRLALADPATGRTLDLGAFGHTNADAFARLLRPE